MCCSYDWAELTTHRTGTCDGLRMLGTLTSWFVLLKGRWGRLVIRVFAHHAKGPGSSPQMHTVCEVLSWCPQPWYNFGFTPLINTNLTHFMKYNFKFFCWYKLVHWTFAPMLHWTILSCSSDHQPHIETLTDRIELDLGTYTWSLDKEKHYLEMYWWIWLWERNKFPLTLISSWGFCCWSDFQVVHN